MAFPSTISDIVATTIQSRSRKIADNVTKNNALLARLKAKGKIKYASGGDEILQELSFQENGNFGWYSGYDPLPIAPQDVISAARYSWKQAACAVTISGLDKLKNSGKEKMIDLLESRVAVAESTFENGLASAVYGDGTAAGGKAPDGLGAAVPAAPTTGTYGGIDRSVWSFWQSKLYDAYAANSNAHVTTSTVQPAFNAMYAKLVRGKDKPDLILVDDATWLAYVGSLQLIQRITDPAQADLGFPSVKFFGSDVVLDGGAGGFAPTNVARFLNTDYIFLRPHKDCDVVPLGPSSRTPTNGDSEVQVIGWAGNLTCSNASLQGYLKA